MVEQQVLHLHTMWPSHRTRWWALVTMKEYPMMPIPHFPDLTWEPSILHLLPVMMKLTPLEHQQLELDLYELRQFHSSPKGINEHTLKPMKSMPTATHSWGSQVTECKCGCRSTGFSSERISKHGLYGILWPLGECVKLGVEEVTKFRHLHPKEVAVLCGMCPDLIPDANATHLRLSLAGVGQMASPLHAAWVGGHLVESIQHTIPGTMQFTKHQALVKVVERLFRTRDLLIPHAQRTRYMDLFEKAVYQVLSPPQQPLIEDIGPSNEDLLSTVIQAEQSISHEAAGQSMPTSDEEFSDEMIRETLALPSSSIESQIGEFQHDPYWECPFDDCFICNPQLKVAPLNAPNEPPKDVHEVDGAGEYAISPTIPYEVQEPSVGEPAFEDCKKGGDNIAATVTGSKVIPFDAAGGVPSFKNVSPKRSQTDHEALEVVQIQKRPRIAEVYQQKGTPNENAPNAPVGVDQQVWEGTVGQSNNRHALIQPPQMPETSQSRQVVRDSSPVSPAVPEGRIVQVVHPSSCLPLFVKTSVTATIGDILTAEKKVGDGQPLKAYNEVGHELERESRLQPFQRIHIKADDPSGEVSTFESSCIPHVKFVNRFHALLHQGPWVANDEIDFYLDMVGSHVEVAKVCPLTTTDTGDIEQWVQQISSKTIHDGPVISAILSKDHWIPIVVLPQTDMKTVHTSSEGRQVVHSLFGAIEGFRVSTAPMPSQFQHDCGFQTIHWISNVVQKCQWTSSFTPHVTDPVTATTAAIWRSLFDHHIHANNLAKSKVDKTTFRVGGTKHDNLESQLGGLLHEHGVPSDQIESRCAVIFEKLGRAAVVQLMRSSKPWAELKSLANAQLPKLQLILPSELAATIQARLASKTEFGHKKIKKQPEKKPPIVIQLKPEDLSIPGMIFKQGCDEAVQQIPFSSIGVDAKGVVLVTAEQAKPYLALQKPISKHGLAMLVLDHSNDVCSGVGQIIRFPAQCQATNEPIIATARLIQLGQVEISRHLPESQLKVDEIPTAVVRIVVYRDEFEEDWQQFIQHPVKRVLQKCPELQTTNNPELEILDVWDRQFVNIKLEKNKASEAAVFIVTIRVKGADHKTLLTSTGEGGIYIEPRSDDGRKPSFDYRVVWLQKVDKATAVSSVQASRQWASLVRSGHRYGIRTTTEAAEAVHQVHKPNTPYIDSSSMVSYMVGPWPYGATRGALQKIFVKWGWDARPLQPRGRSADATGVLWEVQAAQKPQYEVYSMEHSDVLITEIQKKRPIDHQPSDVLASAKTIALLKTQQAQHQLPPPQGHHGKGEYDPIFAQDPWKHWTPPSKVARPNQGATSSQAGASTEVIQANVERKFAATIAALEEKVAARDVAMSSVEPAESGKVAELEARMNQLEGAVQHQSMQLQQHQSQVTQQFTQIQSQVDQQASSLQRHLDQRLQEQLGHIERLLHKKPRDSQE